jgi:hypothetical protein
MHGQPNIKFSRISQQYVLYVFHLMCVCVYFLFCCVPRAKIGPGHNLSSRHRRKICSNQHECNGFVCYLQWLMGYTWSYHCTLTCDRSNNLGWRQSHSLHSCPVSWEWCGHCFSGTVCWNVGWDRVVSSVECQIFNFYSKHPIRIIYI